MQSQADLFIRCRLICNTTGYLQSVWDVHDCVGTPAQQRLVENGCAAGDDGGPASYSQCLTSGALSTVASMGAALLVAAVSMVLVGM
jgi:hypothetical protein